MQLEAIKAEGSPDNLAKRTAARLIEKSELVLRRASAAIRLGSGHDFGRGFDREATSAWEPPGPSTRPIRTSPGCAIAGAGRRSPVLARHAHRLAEPRIRPRDGWDGQKYTGLVLPTDSAGDLRPLSTTFF